MVISILNIIHEKCSVREVWPISVDSNQTAPKGALPALVVLLSAFLRSDAFQKKIYFKM